jgi:rhodanese-related sulfurtransferase
MLFNKACGQKTYDEKLQSLYKNTVPLVSPEFLEERRNTSDSVYIFDTRSNTEFEVSHIPGAKLIEYESYDESDFEAIPKDAEIVLYCSVGYRSERVGEKLLEMGYENVSNLYGGIFQWKNTGKEVIAPDGNVTDSVHTYNRKWSKWLEKGTKVYE